MAASTSAMMQQSSRAVSCRAFSSSRSVVVCQAASANPNRRALLGVTLLPALVYVPQALALIPDEEDEELLEKAKANRKAKLASQRTTTREFLRSEGLKSVRLGAELVPVQRAVYKLAKGGAQLELGDLKGLNETLSEPWVAEFPQSAKAVGGNVSPEYVITSIRDLKTAAATGNLKKSKAEYVAVVAAVQEWANGAGLEEELKGL